MGKFDKDKDEKNTTNQSGKVNFPQANAARNALGQNSTTQTGVGGGKFNTDSDRQQRIYNAMKDAARIQARNMETAYNSLLGSMQNTGWKSAEDMDTIGTSLENVENLLNMRRFSSGQNEDLTALESSLKNIRSQYESDRKVYGQFTSAEEYDGFLEQLRQMRQLETTYGQRYWDTFGSGDYTEGQLLQKGGNQWAAFGSWANQQEVLSQAQNARNDEARYLEELEAIKDSIAKRYGFSGGSDVTNDETISYAREAVETYPEDSEVYKEAKAFLDAWEGAGTARETALAKDEEARLAGDDAQMYRDLEQIWALPEDVQQGIRVVYADTNAAKNENDPINLGMENTVAAQYRELLEREYDITPQRALELGETQQRYENMVRSNEEREQWQQWAKDQPVWNYLGGLGANFAGVVTDTLGTMRNLGRNYYSTADPYDPLYAFSQYGETVHSTIGEGIDNDILKVIYSGATSALDNGLRIGAGLLTGHPGMSLGLAGVGSFNDTFRDASQRGATREQALLLGTTAAALEVGTEKISLDRLLKPGNVASVTDVVREVLMQGGVEVSEEELSLLGNALADSVIMGSNSDLELRANEYAKANGVSVDRAMGKLLLGDIMETAATTLISAGLMSGTRSIAELYTNQETGRRVLREGNLETYLTAAEALGEDSKAAEYLNKKGISPKSTAGQVGTFAGLVNQEGQRLLDQITTGTNQEEVTKAYLTAAEVLENNSDASVVARNLFHAKALELGFDPTEATSAYQTRSAQRKAGYIESVINSGDTSRGTIHRAAAAIRRDQGYQDQYEKQTGVQWTGTRAIDRLNGKARTDKKNLKSVIEKRKESSATKPDDAGEYVTATTNGRVRTKDGSIEPMFGIDIRDNEIYALLPAGKEQKLDDVTVGGTLGDLINYAQERFKNGTYDADAVRTMVMGYTDNNDPGELEQYVQAFKEVYTAGRLNPDVAEDEVAAYIEELREGGEGPLQDQAPEGMFPDHVRIETFKAGQRAAKREAEQGATETKKARHKGTGKVANERTGKGSTDQGKFQAFVTALAKNRLSHVDIKLVDKIAAGEGEANGAFAADILTIYLSGSADHELQALIHEMGELGKAYNREEYRSVRQELLTFWAEKQGFNEVESLIGQYMMRYGAAGNVTVDEVLDEIFNDAMGAILGSEGQLQSLVDWASTGPEQTQEQRQGVLKKLAKAIRKVIQGIRSLLKRWELNPGTEQFLELEAKQMDQLRQRFLHMIDEANRRAGETGEYTGNGAAHSFSAQPELMKAYQQTVDQIINGTYKKTDAVVLGYTPEIYQKLGMPSLPFAIGPGHVYSIAKTATEAKKEGRYRKNSNYHGLGVAAVKNIYNAALDPVMIISSKDTTTNATPMRSTHSIIAIINAGTSKTKLLLPIEITAERTTNGEQMDVNVLSSAYRRNVDGLIAEAIAQENVGQVGVYYAKKEATALLADGVQFPKRLTDAIASDGIVHKFQEKVNQNIADQTQSRQFKKWFGDWQNNPAKASKVVNADGTPKVVYHGTNAKFQTFESKKGVYWFSEYEDYAEAMMTERGGGEIKAVYLNMRNPYRAKLSPGQFSDPGYEAPILRKAKENGHDGVIIENDTANPLEEEIFYVVFDPKQIKSATDNVGTFDRSNPDIRYSLTVEPVSEEQAAMQEAERIARLPAQRQREQLQADLETAQRQIDQLEREVKAMKNRGDYFKGQLQRSTTATANAERTHKFARELVQNYESKMDAKEAETRLKRMYDDFRAHFTNLGLERLQRSARDLATDLVQQARTRKDSLYEDYQDLRETLRGTTLTVTPEIAESVQNFAQRRRMNTGRVRVRVADWSNVDSVYHDVLTAQWSGFFREDQELNQADQLTRIFDVAERIYDRELVNPYTGYMDEVIQEVEDSIILGFHEVGREKPTFADQQAARLEQTRQSYRQLLDLQEARLKKVQQELKETVTTDEQLKGRLQRQLQRQERELQRTKDSFEQYRIARKEREGVEKYARQVRERAAKLEQMVYRPSKDTHMPEGLRRPIAQLLESLPALYEERLNASSNRGEYMPGRKYAKALENLMNTIGKPEGLDQDSGLVDIDGVMVDLPGEIREMIKKQYDAISEAVNNWDSFEGKAWNAETLKQLSAILRALTTAINKVNTLHTEGIFSGVDEAARNTMGYMEELGNARGSAAKRAGTNERTAGELDKAVWDNLVPYYAMQRYGDAGAAMFAGLRQGQSELAMLAKQIQDFATGTFTTKEAKAWEKEAHTFTLHDGETLTLTAAQMMELHLLRQRKNGLQHITSGGIKAGRVEAYHLTMEELEEISGTLTDRQKEVAQKLQQFVSTVGSEWGNYVSMARFGFKGFTEKNYWTIKTDNHSRNEAQREVDRAGEKSIYQLLNMSFTKPLNEKATNAIILGNVFETFANHMVDMAKYKALALPVLDVIRWYGYRKRVDRPGQADAQEENTSYDWTGTQQSIEKALGKNAVGYVRQMLIDLSGQGGGHDVALQKIAGKMISNYKVAAVGANLRVALLQPTALTRAMLIIPPKYFTKNIIGGRVNDVEIWKMDGDQLRQEIRRMGAIKEMQHYSGIAVWKKLGYYDPSFGRSLTDVILGREGLFGTMQDLSMTPAEVGDLLTWGRIWKACKAMIRETQGLSGETLLQETAKKFDEVVYATQVVDTPLTRSANMRSKGDITKAFTAFMAEPTLGMNVLMDAAHRIRLDSRRMGKGKAWQRNWQYGVKALAVWCGTKVFSALMASIMDAARDDDDYEKYWEKWLQAFAGEKTPLDGNLLQELLPWNDLPFIGDIAAGIGEIFGVDTTNFVRMETAVIPDIVNVIQIWKETYELQMGIVENPTDVTYNNKMTLYGKLYKTMQAASRLTGLPVANLTRDAVALYNTFVGGPNDMRVQTYDLGTEGAIKNALGAGTLTEHDALYHLVEDAGLTSDEAFWKVREWTSGSKLSALQEAIQSGDDGRIQAALEEMYTYGYTKSQAENAARNVIKNLYLDKKNPISKERATELLAAYGNRSEEKELYDLFSQWDYVREHGDTDGYNMYADVDDAVAQGEDIQEAMDQLKEHGYKTTTIESHIKAYIGEQYRNGQMDRKAAEARLTQYLGGMSEAETYELFAKWDYMGPEGSGEDFSVYTGLSNALVLGNGDQIQSEIDYLKEHGYTMDQIVSATTSAIGEAFINDYIDEKTATELLQTWTRSQNQDEIFKLMEKWNYAREHEGGTTGWSLYQELDEAVENGLSIKDACAALQAGGIDTDTITNHIQDTVEDAYLNGNISKTEARDRLTRYVGMDEDGLYWEMKELDWKKANPYGEYRGEYQDLYNAIDGGKSIQAATEELLAHGETEKTVNGAVKGYITDLYKDGTISEDRAREYLQRYLGLADTPKQNATVDDYALYWAMHELNYKKTHSGSYGKYYQVYEAIDNGTALSSIYTGLLNHGAQKGNIKSGIQSHYKDDLIELYYSGSSEDRERYALLRGRIASAVEALGYSRYDMLRTIDGWIAEAK